MVNLPCDKGYNKRYLRPDWDRAQWRTYIHDTVYDIVRHGDYKKCRTYEDWEKGERITPRVRDFWNMIVANTRHSTADNQKIRMAFVEVARDLPKTNRHSRYWDEWLIGMVCTDGSGEDGRKVARALDYQKHVLPFKADRVRNTLAAYLGWS
ncbi:MAG: hypothetical protein H6868_09385 [Rhodospirillales bacterium]|nr:hypothetical protein [Rhodospirillales bacterium]